MTSALGRVMNFALNIRPAHRRAILIVVGLVGLSRVGMSFAMDALNIYLKKGAPCQSDVLWQDVPRVLGQWEAVGDDQRLSEEFIEELGTDPVLLDPTKTQVADSSSSTWRITPE